MRFEDVGDYFRVRAIATNPWQVVRFRKGHRLGSELRVEMRSGGPLLLRGGHAGRPQCAETVRFPAETAFVERPRPDAASSAGAPRGLRLRGPRPHGPDRSDDPFESTSPFRVR